MLLLLSADYVGVWAGTTYPTLPTPKAMEFLSTCLLSPGMQMFCLTRTQPFFDALHVALAKSAGQMQHLLVITVLGQLCLLESRWIDDVFRPYYSCAQALKKMAFSSFLPGYRAAVMVGLCVICCFCRFA